MDLSIIILNYKTRGLLKQCLRGVQLFDLNLDYEIIVVDNHSGDGTVEMMRGEFPHIKLITSPENNGFAAGVNLGIKEAIGNYLLLLNTDVAILDNAIRKMYDFMESYSQAGLAGPKLLNPDGSTQLSCYRFPSFFIPIYRRTPLGKLPFAKKNLRKYLMLDWNHKESRTVDWILGACMIVKKEAVNKVGLMDERFFLYFEDVDWCRRFWQNGYKVYYMAEVELVHYHKRESAENPGLKGVFSYPTRIHIASWLKYFAKYLGAKTEKNK